MYILVLNMVVVLQEEKVDGSLEFLILASDGLWDVVSNEVCNDFRFFHFLLSVVEVFNDFFIQSYSLVKPPFMISYTNI